MIKDNKIIPKTDKYAIVTLLSYNEINPSKSYYLIYKLENIHLN